MRWVTCATRARPPTALSSTSRPTKARSRRSRSASSRAARSRCRSIRPMRRPSRPRANAFARPRSERLYGLTERLRDAPVAGRRRHRRSARRHRPARGRLARSSRRDRRDAHPAHLLGLRAVLPVVARVRARGRRHDVRRLRSREDRSGDGAVPLRDRHRRRRAEAPRVRALRRPRLPTILDEYTGVVGRPFVPPDWAFLHWRWRDELAPRRARRCSTARPSTPSSPTTCSCTTRSASRPACTCSIARCSPASTASRAWAWDEVRLPNPDAMLQSLKRRGYPHHDLEQHAGRAAATPGDNGVEAQALGLPRARARSGRPIAPTPAAPASSST